MKVLLIFAVLCLLAIARTQSLDLTSESFDKTIADNQFVLNMFYAPWCGHCKTLKPVFDEASKEVEGKYVLSKVDCTVEAELCQKFEVRGYPTVVFFKNGNKKEYDGPRTKEGIIAWLDKKAGPVATKIASSSDLETFNAKKNSVVGYFSSEESAEFKNFLAAAESQNVEEFVFGYVSDSALFGSNKDGDIRSVVNGNEIVVPSDQKESGPAIANYLFDQSFPVVGEVGPENFKNYVARKKPLMLAWVKYGESTKDEQIAAFSKIAPRYPQYSFGYINHDQFGANLERMGASGKVVPAILLLAFPDGKPVSFEREGEWSEESITEWIDGVISGKYKYQPKSEAVPENNDGGVKVIVGTTFDQIVHDANKDVLVEFYAPWCGHCKSLAPEFDKLGEQFKGVEDIVIGKIDLTANDVETSHHEVKGFPTILLYKRDDKKNPLVYKGARDAPSIAAWIKDNSQSAGAKNAAAHDEL